MTMKKIIGLLIIISIFGGIYLYIKLDKSYELYEEANKLYAEGEVKQAYKKVNDALAVNNLNKKALILRAKLYRIITSLEKYREAETYYKESKKSYFEEDYEKAKLYIAKSYEAVMAIPLDAQNRKEADDLKSLIDKDLAKINSTLPKIYYEKALTLTAKNEYIAAFEYLERLDNSDMDSNILKLKSEIAFKIGTSRYTSIVQRKDVKENEILDAVYWLEHVDKNDPNFQIAQKYKQIMKNYLGR